MSHLSHTGLSSMVPGPVCSVRSNASDGSCQVLPHHIKTEDCKPHREIRQLPVMRHVQNYYSLLPQRYQTYTSDSDSLFQLSGLPLYAYVSCLCLCEQFSEKSILPDFFIIFCIIDPEITEQKNHRQFHHYSREFPCLLI